METNQRYCLTLDLQDEPALIEEYKQWHKHEHIWPEIPEGIRSVGIKNMQIYLLGTRMFMIIETGPGFNFEKDMERLSTLPSQSEWEEFVSRFQKTPEGSTSSEKWKLMEMIFELDPGSGKVV
jgi:L-rhamnose mutarotase